MAKRYLDETSLAFDFYSGQKAAFIEIWDDYFPLLYERSYKYTQNEAESEDIASVSLTKAFERHSDFTSLRALRSFLFTTAVNASLNYIRDSKRRGSHEKAITASQIDLIKVDIEEEISEAYYIRHIYQLIETLPNRSKQVVKLIFLEDKEAREIASILKISINTVWNLRTTGLKKLRFMLEQQGLLCSYFILLLFELLLKK